ncbi:MAG: hypothetical protein ACT4P1_03280 [Sporichthyaceae bacterium]
MVGIDGATYSKLTAAKLPNVTALQKAGTSSPSSLFANPMANSAFWTVDQVRVT